MQYFTCADIQIPLFFVDAVSWTKTARTVQHSGGYISARGFEAAEISLRAVFNQARCAPFDHDLNDSIDLIMSIHTDRASKSGVLYIGNFAIYPELEFALTNINKTIQADETGNIYAVEADMVFSGVKAVKEVVRNRSLEIEPVSTMPEVVLGVDGKELKLQDAFQITEFITEPDSIRLGVSVGSDLDLVSRDGFLTSLLNGGVISAALPQGEKKYYVVSADLVDEELHLTGSFYPPKSMQSLSRTYSETTIKAVIDDLSKEAGIDCECLADGPIDYFLGFGTPIECIRQIQSGAGFIMSYRGGVLTCANVPDSLFGEYDINYIDLTQDANSEQVKGVYWYDGVNCHTEGTIDSTAIRVYSPFRSARGYASECLKFARYSRNSIVVVSDIDSRIDSHSVVTVRSNDAIIDCMIEHYSFDWISGLMTLECHYL